MLTSYRFAGIQPEDLEEDEERRTLLLYDEFDRVSPQIIYIYYVKV